VKSCKPIRFIAVFLLFVLVSTPVFAQQWKFAVMSDTQWKASPDNKNPNTVAVNVINHLNQEFIKHKVKFVIAVGDVTDNGSNLALDNARYVRAGSLQCWNRLLSTAWKS
jgi:hypothetical protein